MNSPWFGVKKEAGRRSQPLNGTLRPKFVRKSRRLLLQKPPELPIGRSSRWFATLTTETQRAQRNFSVFSVVLWFHRPHAASTFPFVSGNRKAAMAMVAYATA